MSSSSQEENEKIKNSKKKNNSLKVKYAFDQTLAKFSITDLYRANTVVCRIP